MLRFSGKESNQYLLHFDIKMALEAFMERWKAKENIHTSVEIEIQMLRVCKRRRLRHSQVLCAVIQAKITQCVD